MVMYKVISRCPVCNDKLKITRLKCSSCNTIIENEFQFSKFDTLNNEQLEFVEIFLKCRGNIKDVEKELGISYPTVRSKLDEVIHTLGLKNHDSKDNTKVLELLDKGEITAEEAMGMLKNK
ncbi:hypothetical protein M918_03250 [Clostridium sp. BL8]|nr:hypothetical protein M918_03250 [Clostridium sp. BL8]